LIKAVRRAGSFAGILTQLMLLVVITLGPLPLFDPDPSIMSGIPWVYQAHILAAFALLAFWPFSRLVHVWTSPVQYIRRSQIPHHGPRHAPALA
jgi:nitrate reductase gamma subunit